MADKKHLVAVQRDNDKGGMTSWQNGLLQINAMSGEVVVKPYGIRLKDWAVTLRPDLVTSYEIMMINNPGSTMTMHFGGLLAYLITLLMSRWTKIPVLKFEQVNARLGERSVVIRSAETLPRKPTREIATQIANLLRERGSKIMLPDLVDETPWKYPWRATLAGVGLFILALVALFARLFVLIEYT